MKLNDTQLVILSAASQRKDGAVVLPETLTGKAAEKVVSALDRKQLIEVVPSRRKLPVWRESEDGHHLSLKITDKGLQAIGIEPQDQNVAAEPAHGAAAEPDAGSAPERTSMRRAASKQARVLDMLRREKPSGRTALCRRWHALHTDPCGETRQAVPLLCPAPARNRGRNDRRGARGGRLVSCGPAQLAAAGA